MRFTTLVAVAALASLVAGCAPHAQKGLRDAPEKSLEKDNSIRALIAQTIPIVSWEGYQRFGDEETTQFYLNGKAMGAGAAGLRRVVVALRSAEEGTPALVVRNRWATAAYIEPYQALGLEGELRDAMKSGPFTVHFFGEDGKPDLAAGYF